MATTKAGAGAMGGKQMMLRVATARVTGLDFRQVSATEVRTISAIPAADLEVEAGAAWEAL
jgi:hypothetical protein